MKLALFATAPLLTAAHLRLVRVGENRARNEDLSKDMQHRSLFNTVEWRQFMFSEMDFMSMSMSMQNPGDTTSDDSPASSPGSPSAPSVPSATLAPITAAPTASNAPSVSPSTAAPSMAPSVAPTTVVETLAPSISPSASPTEVGVSTPPPVAESSENEVIADESTSRSGGLNTGGKAAVGVAVGVVGVALLAGVVAYKMKGPSSTASTQPLMS